MLLYMVCLALASIYFRVQILFCTQTLNLGRLCAGAYGSLLFLYLCMQYFINLQLIHDLKSEEI